MARCRQRLPHPDKSALQSQPSAKTSGFWLLERCAFSEFLHYLSFVLHHSAALTAQYGAVGTRRRRT